MAATDSDTQLSGFPSEGHIRAAGAIAEDVADEHRVRENITAHYVGCSCGVALSHLSYAAHVAHETVAALAAADLLRSE